LPHPEGREEPLAASRLEEGLELVCGPGPQDPLWPASFRSLSSVGDVADDETLPSRVRERLGDDDVHLEHRLRVQAASPVGASV
jgi:hypothetical protein